jgi:hypothetical protein
MTKPLMKGQIMKNKSASHSALIGLFVVLAFAFCNSPARATTTTTWIDTVGDWFNAAKWDHGVPTSTTDALINNGGTAQINSPGNANAASVTLGLNAGDSGALTVDGTNATLGLPCSTDIAGIFPGLISVGYRGTGKLSITNGGRVASEWAYIAAVAGAVPNLTSHGSVTVDGAGSTWTISSPCGSAARLFIGGSLGASGDDPGGIALLNVTNGGEVTVDNPANQTSVKVGISGTLAGNGTIKTIYHPPYGLDTVVAVSGTISPSWTLNIDGDLFLLSTATTQCNVTPDNLNMVDVDVSRTGNLGGRLSVTMTGTFTPGTQFTLLHSQGLLSSRFSSVSIKYPMNQGFTPVILYDYTGNHVYLYLEPNT